MKIRSLFLASVSLVTGAATAMERPASPDREQPRALEITDIFTQFEKVRVAIIGKAKAQGLQIPANSFANDFAIIFTKAIQQASSVQLSNSERENLGKCITSYLALETLDKQINAIKQNKNLIAVITKIIGDKTAQAAVLAQAFKAVDQKYATQEQIEQIIAQAFGQQSNSVSTIAPATNPSAQPKRVKFYWEDSSDDDDLDEKSFELAWKLQQEQMAESKQELHRKPASQARTTEEDEALAKAIALSEQTTVQPVQPSVSIAEDEAYARALALSQQATEQEPVVTVNTEDEEFQLALAISKEETKQVTQSTVDPDLERVLRMSQKQEESKNKGGKEEIPLPNKDQKNTTTKSPINTNPKVESKNASKEIECDVCGESRDSRIFELALNEHERNEVLSYIASDKGIESRLPGIKKYTESCMHTLCKECKKTMALGYQPEGEENVNVLIRVYCPTCNIRTRTAKRS